MGCAGASVILPIKDLLMARYVAAAIAPLFVAACAPSASDTTNGAVIACQRADVQDVVGKEARSLMLKGNRDNLLTAGMMGLDLNSVFKAWEEARVSFSGAGAFPSSKGPPYQQIVCGNAVQFDLSDATAGQQIVNLPRLRWTINFAQPTDDPATGGFTVEIDPVSLVDGRTLNGKPMILSQPQDSGDNQAQAAADAQAAAEEGGAAANDAAAAAAAAANDFDAASQVDAGPSRQRTAPAENTKTPSEDELYAPHGN